MSASNSLAQEAVLGLSLRPPWGLGALARILPIYDHPPQPAQSTPWCPQDNHRPTSTFSFASLTSFLLIPASTESAYDLPPFESSLMARLFLSRISCARRQGDSRRALPRGPSSSRQPQEARRRMSPLCLGCESRRGPVFRPFQFGLFGRPSRPSKNPAAKAK